jgi:hypothetical protein
MISNCPVLTEKKQGHDSDSISSVNSNKRQRTSSLDLGETAFGKSAPNLNEIMKLVENNPSVEALLRAKFHTPFPSDSPGHPDIGLQDSQSDRPQSFKETEVVSSPSPSPSPSPSVSEKDGTEESDDETGMVISEGLSLRKSYGGKVSREGKIKSGKKRFRTEDRDAQRWSVMFAAIRYEYVAHGPAKSVPANEGRPFDAPEYTAMVTSRYHSIFGSHALPMTPLELDAVFPSLFLLML